MADSEDLSQELGPRQDPETIREIRKNYRDEIAYLEENKEQLMGSNNTELTERVKQLDDLYKLVQRTQEAKLDSRALKLVADIGAGKAERLRTDAGQFDVDDFLKRVVAKLGPAGDDESELDWAGAGEIAFSFALTPPTIGFMLGPLAIVPKEKRVVNKPKKEEVKVVRPKEMDSEELQKQSAVETTKLVRGIHKALQHIHKETGEAVDLLQFITNPDPQRGFSQTVENLFYVSFLVRDDKVKWHFDDDGLLLIEPLEHIDDGYEAEQQQQAKQGQRQLIVNMSYDNWKDAVELYSITSPLIPNRTAVPEAGKNWAG